MRTGSLSTAVTRALCALLLGAALQGCDSPTQSGTPEEALAVSNLTGELAQAPARIAEVVNAERAARGLSSLRIDARLGTAAQIQSAQMASFDRLAHDIPGAAYPTFAARIHAVKYPAAWVGENLAYNYREAQAVVAAWLASPTHRDNLLSPHPVAIGIAGSVNADGEPYFAAVLGRPN